MYMYICMKSLTSKSLTCLTSKASEVTTPMVRRRGPTAKINRIRAGRFWAVHRGASFKNLTMQSKGFLCFWGGRTGNR